MMRPEGSLDGEDYRLVLETPYDGTVTLTHARRAELPVVLTSLEEGATGPFATVLTWIAPDAAARDARSVVGRIARERVMPVLHRLALTLRARSGGAVVDAGGFLVTPRELESRASR
jgi:hypothetical protein